jgi:hypothetical protein
MPHDNSDLQNAGNDATFTLHAMIMLAIESSKYREMSFIEKENLELLQALAQLELYECQR